MNTIVRVIHVQLLCVIVLMAVDLLRIVLLSYRMFVGRESWVIVSLRIMLLFMKRCTVLLHSARTLVIVRINVTVPSTSCTVIVYREKSALMYLMLIWWIMKFHECQVKMLSVCPSHCKGGYN